MCGHVCRRVRRQVLEASSLLRCGDVRSVCDGSVGNGCGFHVLPAVGQSLPVRSHGRSRRDGEILDSDDDDLPSVKQIPASSKRAKRVVDLTGDDGDDREDDDGDLTKASWLRTTRMARHLVRLIPPSLIDLIQVADQLCSHSTALSAKVTGTRCRRPHNVVYSGRLPGRKVLGSMFLGGHNTSKVKGIPTSLLTTRP
jgi:hypothetical protein